MTLTQSQFLPQTDKPRASLNKLSRNSLTLIEVREKDARYAKKTRKLPNDKNKKTR
jgi:hypothetical protein